MSNNKSSNVPTFDNGADPYDLMGVTPDTSETDISKAYRKLALKLHPDKQQQKSEKEKERVAKLFHDVKEARAFLLDPEYAEQRRKYKLKRSSEKLRKEQDAKREKSMSDRRKRMKEQLEQKEKGEAANKQRKKQRGGSTTTEQQDFVDKLRKEGSKAREDLAYRKAREEHQKEKQKQKLQKAALEDRQIRLKWSRSRMKISPSEHSITELLSKQFGAVESVEFIGAKGNMALVTFGNALSCKPCVDAYLHSEEMRASFIGKRKEREEELQRNRETTTTSNSIMQQQKESLEERKIRQAVERQALLRKMEMEDKGITAHVQQPQQDDSREEFTSSKIRSKKASTDFPPKFQICGNDNVHQNLSPFQILEAFEKSILQGIV
mmetsp:Transcript_26366/g.40452  ORF Transcript_26366/g.40452 Transcript_26366/m.40452 type:complete len:380 (-) Transcript_26366:60-1199(-)